MAAKIYTTKTGDMLDLICFRHYRGRQSGAVEHVLEVNRDKRLSYFGPYLPPNLTIVLPDLPNEITTAEPLQKLWE